MFLGVGVWLGLAQVGRSRPPLSSITSGRWEIWTGAAAIAYDHPLFGVGPSNYNVAMLDGGYAERYLPLYPRRFLNPPDLGAMPGTEQAHNLLLHVAAETGIESGDGRPSSAVRHTERPVRIAAQANGRQRVSSRLVP